MPPKDLDHIGLTEGSIYIDGYKYDNIASLQNAPDITPIETPRARDEWTRINVSTTASCEFNCKVKNPGKLTASLIMLLTGNDLYIRFPKKLRRRRKRRCRNI